MTHATPIHWTCSRCGFRIADRNGTVAIPLPFADQPRPLDWQAYHDNCHPEYETYSIPVEQLRTPAGLVRWTAHLYAKRWASNTDWHHLISDAVPAKGSGAWV